MLTGPTPACRKALAKAGMTRRDIDLWEINEAFAVVPMKTARDLGVDLDRVNVNGGSIAMGHPLGATGCIILGTLLDELERRNLRHRLRHAVRRRRHGHRHHHREGLIMSAQSHSTLGDDGILVATMDLPGRPMNVVDDELMDGIAGARRAARRPGDQGPGADLGKADFCAGGDLDRMSQVDDAAGAVRRRRWR